MEELFITEENAKFPCANCGEIYHSPMLSDGMPLYDIFCCNDCGHEYFDKSKALVAKLVDALIYGESNDKWYKHSNMFKDVAM